MAGKLASGTSSLLDVVQNQVEPSIIKHGQNHGHRPAGWKRPFLETPSANRPLLSKTIKEDVPFPEQDESVGEIQISFLGPNSNSFVERKVGDHGMPSYILTDVSMGKGSGHYRHLLDFISCGSLKQRVRRNRKPFVVCISDLILRYQTHLSCVAPTSTSRKTPAQLEWICPFIWARFPRNTLMA